MARRMRIAKLAAVNVLVFFLLACAVNLVAALIWDGVELGKRLVVPVDEKATRVSLPDHEHAELIFREKKQLRTRYVPYVAWSRMPFRGVTTTVDEAGDRVHPNVVNGPHRHVRLFGGSTMWGTGVDDRHTIPAHLDALRADLRVYNHGESGFVSRQELARLINLVNQGAPMDVVIFYDGCNDGLSLCREDVSLNGHREEAKLVHRLAPRWQTMDALFGAVRTVAEGLKKGRPPHSRCHDDATYAERVAATLVNNWKIARSVAAVGGAEFHAVLQPVARIGRPNIAYIPEMGDGEEWQQVYPAIRAIRDHEQLDWVHDLTDAFDGDEYIYIDGCHVNARGNQIIAERLAGIVPSAAS